MGVARSQRPVWSRKTTLPRSTVTRIEQPPLQELRHPLIQGISCCPLAPATIGDVDIIHSSLSRDVAEVEGACAGAPAAWWNSLELSALEAIGRVRDDYRIPVDKGGMTNWWNAEAERPWKGISWLVLDEAGVSCDATASFTSRTKHERNRSPRAPVRRKWTTWWSPGDGLIPLGLELLPPPDRATSCGLILAEGDSDTFAAGGVRSHHRDALDRPLLRDRAPRRRHVADRVAEAHRPVRPRVRDR